MEDQAEKLREMMRQRKYSAQASIQGMQGASPANRSERFGNERATRQYDTEAENRDRRTRIITITSGKGGVGKTNLSVNMAIAFARMGKKVIVMDADLGLANVNVLLKMIPQFSLYHVIKGQKTIRDILVETEYGISIIAGASGFSQIVNMDEQERINFVNELDSLSFADIIIIDTSAGVSSNVMEFIAAADDAIIITTPEPTAMTDAYSIIKIIATEYDTINLNLKLAINRVKSAAEAKSVADRMIGIAGQYLYLKMDYLGFIYEDTTVHTSVRQQKPFMVYDPKCKASVCIQHLAERMEKNKLIETGGLGSVFRKIFNGGRNV